MIPIDFLLILHMRNVGLYFPLMEHGKKLNLSPGNLKKKTTKICLPQNTLSPYNMYLLLSCVYFRWKNAFLGSISWKTLAVMAAMKTPSPLVPRRSLTSLAAKCTSWTKVKMSRNQKPLVYHPSISHPKHCSTSRAQSAPEWARPLNWSRVPQAAMSAKLRKSAKKQFCAYGETNSAN